MEKRSTTARDAQTDSICFRSLKLYAVGFVLFILFAAVSALVQLGTSAPSAQALTTVPTKMNFQGRLTDASGAIKANGTYNMRLKLYTVSTAGTPVWSEDRLVSATQGITLTNGLFAIQLGDITSLPASLFASGPLYLEIELPTPATATSATPTWTEGPMTPRNQLATSAYAYNAETLDGIDSDQLARRDASNTYAGTNTYQNTSASAFSIQNSGGASTLLNADTSAMKISIGTGAASGSRVAIGGDTQWVSRTAAEPNEWRNVAYGKGLFVAIAFSGTNRVMTSPDGITWTARAAAEANQWRGIVYGGGQFVAVADSGINRVMTSPDGITWTARAVPEANLWRGIAYGNGVYVATSGDGINRVMTSPDGITWTARAATEVNSWNNITFGEGLFVALSIDGINRVMTSPDGITWTARAAAEANQWRSVTYGNGQFVAVSNDGINRVMTSPDGITWTARAAAEANAWNNIGYGNGLFVATAVGGTNRVMTSHDGISWTAKLAAQAHPWRGVGYGNGTFVVVSGELTDSIMTSSANQALNVLGALTVTGETTLDNQLTVKGESIFRSTDNSTSAFSIQNSAGTSVLNVDTVNSQVSLRGANSAAVLGAELITSNDFTTANWTTTGWTTTTTNATHTTGNTTALSTNQFAVTAGATYQITFTIAGNTSGANTVRSSIGGAFSPYLGANDTHTVIDTATTTATLSFVPGTNFNGTISAVSVKQITRLTPTVSLQNSAGTTTLEVRTTTAAQNTFIGLSSGQVNTTGNSNVALGAYSLQSNTTGGGNVAVGANSLFNNTTGYLNTAIGDSSLSSNTTGGNNTSIGRSSMEYNTTGTDNTATGKWSLWYNDSGYENVSNGIMSLMSNTTGFGNTATGAYSLDTNGTGSRNSAFGYIADVGSNNLQNATALGAMSRVDQSDSLVLGCVSGINTCTTTTKVGIGTTTPTKTLDVRGDALIRSASGGDTTAAFSIQNSAGTSLFNVDTTNAGAVTILGNSNGEVGQWNTNANALPAIRQYHSTVVANGYTYAIGGYDGTNIQATVYYSKMNSNGSLSTWQIASNPLPAGRYNHSSVVSNGYVYVFGGYNSGFAPQSTVYYAKLNADGSVGTWSTAANALPSISVSHSATVANGYVYIIGGKDLTTLRTTVYYAKLNADGSVGTWSTAANALPAVRDSHSTVIANGYVYVMGGSNTSSTSGSQSTVYYAKLNADGSVGTWSTAANALPVARSSHSSVVANGWVYVLGGHNGSTNQSTNYYAKLNADGSVSAWSTASSSLPIILDSHSSVVANGNVYVIGGFVSSVQSTVYHARIGGVLQVGGSLDLVGLQGQNLADGGDGSAGSTGGSITAGNITGVGTLQIQKQASFADGVSVTGDFNAGNGIFSVGAGNSVVRVGSSTADATAIVFVLDTKNTAGDPTGTAAVNGAMYYNSNMGKFRCYEGGVWRNCLNGTAMAVATSNGPWAATLAKAAAATILVSPIYIPGPMTVNTFRLDVTTALGAAGDVGLYDSAGNLVLNGGSGTLTTAVGAKAIPPTQTGTARVLQPGQYFMAVTWNSTTGVMSGANMLRTGLIGYAGTLATGGGLVLPTTITPSSVALGSYVYGVSISTQ